MATATEGYSASKTGTRDVTQDDVDAEVMMGDNKPTPTTAYHDDEFQCDGKFVRPKDIGTDRLKKCEIQYKKSWFSVLERISSFDARKQFFDVILYYAHDATEIVQNKLCKYLKNNNLAFTENGQNYNLDFSTLESVQLGLANSTKIILVISPDFVKSRHELGSEVDDVERGWNYYKIEQAMTDLIENPHRSLSVVVTITTNDVKIPNSLRTRNRINLETSKYLTEQLDKMFTKDVRNIRYEKEKEASKEKGILEKERDKVKRKLELIRDELLVRGISELDGGECLSDRPNLQPAQTNIYNINASNLMIGKGNKMNIGVAQEANDSSSDSSESDEE